MFCYYLKFIRKKFVCHHSGFNKVPTEKNIKGNSKNTQCPAYILCTIKLDTPWTRKTDSFVKVRVAKYLVLLNY